GPAHVLRHGAIGLRVAEGWQAANRRGAAARPRLGAREGMSLNTEVLTRWFEQHRSFLWGLSYRMTGSAADADDVVQETFVRAWKHAPDGLDDPRGWLMRVAINAGRDVLRRRKRRGYVGPWLPTPIATGEDVSSLEPVADGPTLEGQYGLTESAS